MKRSAHLAPVAVFAAVLLLGWAAAAEKPRALSTDEAGRLFLSHIQPLLKERCLGCHGDDKKESDLDLRSRQGMLKGGFGGPVLVPGRPEESTLYIAVTRKQKDLRMPPKEENRLSAEQVEMIRQWIAAGAPWPERAVSTTEAKWTDPNGISIATSGGLSPEWTNRKYKPEDVWAYRPIQRTAVPEIRNPQSTIRNPIDAFILARLNDKGLKPAPPADKRTLIRRVTLDLTGLPPTPEEIDAFLADDSPDAWEKVIDRLLASPHYGEQWARHWLDVVRYADTSGFSNDFERPTAWRYRDYVVRAFNQDKPFDRFIVEQIAGDELASSPPARGEGGDPELLIAVGFLRMGPWEHTGMSVAAVTRQQFLDDVTNAVGVTFLAQGLRCARCHDHKFDPIPTRDYYRIQAVFAPVQFADRLVPFQPWENTSAFAELRPVTERRLREAKDFLAALRRKNQEAVAELLKRHGVKSVNELPGNMRPQQHFGLTPLEMSLQKIYQKRVAYYERELIRYQPYAFSVYNGPLNVPNEARSPLTPLPPPEKRRGEPQEVFILKGGALETPGDPVTPGVLSAMHGSNDRITPSAWNTIPTTMEGRRLALARWIASPHNTLTARVIVNRIWQHHFAGKGIVATPNNFGKMGKRPTHPELLDWLATWFMEHGWSVKKLHRLILTSAVYQQSGNHPDREKIDRIDPNNDLLAYHPPRRLAAEEIRDGMLALTGELNREMGGPGCYPEINWEVALQPRHIMGSVAPAYQPSPRPEQRNRRSIYAFRYRTLSDPLLEVFNRPDSDTSCERRDETTVTPQVFALFNSQFVHDRA
ncbi:MAG TPA: PSD1 and planctomycete cytochrome C domain-containing protein, partial [Gemmataceae bacterium]|nr:PSD1 and planctomycete cytochrome C domain-containing protein [Gemmataceae bacterium]